MLYSVTSRIKSVQQPQGGYVRPRDFKIINLNDEYKLNVEENIHPTLVGLAVDYMTRFMMGTPLEQVFFVSFLGAKIIKEENNAKELLAKIKGLDDISIICACKLVGYDVCYRNGIAGYKPVNEIKPDQKTIENIVIMIQRSINFWNIYGPIIKDGFTFEGGYTYIVSKGDGDFLTKDTLWDFKVSRAERITSKHTLQLLMYYIMGCHSKHEEFRSIKKLGIYNPRKNRVYSLDISMIPSNIIQKVSHDIIGYGMTKNELLIELNKRRIDESFLDILKEMMPDVEGKEEFENTDLQYYLKQNESINQFALKKGDKVCHSKFGIGKVINLKKIKEYSIATVLFDNVGEKDIVTSYLKLV